MDNEIVTPENTKLIADWMGYESQPLTDKSDNVMIVIKGLRMLPFVYNLITNADQSREVEKKLLELGWRVDREEEKYLVLNYSKPENGFAQRAATLELAIYKAALWEAKNERT